MEKPQTILIENALIISNDPEQPPVFLGWLYIAGNSIEKVREGSPPENLRSGRVIKAKNNVLIPGLVNTHAHSHSTLTRGSAEGLSLENWLKSIEKEQKHLTEEQEYIGALATYAEALLSGTTLISDMCLHPHQAYRAAKEIGIRAVISPYVAKTKPFTPTIEGTRSLITETSNNCSRVQIWCGLHDIESCGDRQITEGKNLANEFETGLHMHCAETNSSTKETKERTGKSPVSHLYDLGMLNKKTLLAHCVWINEEDINLLANDEVNVAHCPHANLKLGSGFAPVKEMVDAGINVTLATDGAKANNSLDMFDVMKFASLVHKGLHQDPTILPPEKILEMATKGGSEALQVSSGIIAEGALADIILIRSDNLHIQPLTPETAITNIVHAARGSDVELVIVDGNILVEDGKIRSVNYDWLLDQVKMVSNKLMSISV